MRRRRAMLWMRSSRLWSTSGLTGSTELGLGRVGGGARPRVEGDVEQRRPELLLALRLPGPDGGPAVLGAGRDVRAALVEAAVAPDPTGDEGLGHGIALEQLVLGPVHL